MEIKLKLEQDNRNNCILIDTYITFKIAPRLTIITLDSPLREVAIRTDELKKILSII